MGQGGKGRRKYRDGALLPWPEKQPVPISRRCALCGGAGQRACRRFVWARERAEERLAS